MQRPRNTRTANEFVAYKGRVITERHPSPGTALRGRGSRGGFIAVRIKTANRFEVRNLQFMRPRRDAISLRGAGRGRRHSRTAINRARLSAEP
ncbi:hypothetical protein EVAR_8383_1 [Eumeta japonica]|uniref:Uncharacterized protein n=1 Tax=Eumeta variegata TaxID=151549 RepID=A0A4C1VBL9_EUMVA|nr:hypothetical protein EVAR_8383_1 [Eumeta japonica]